MVSAKTTVRTVEGETDRAIRAASHLTDADAGTVEVLRRLAGEIDYLLANGGMNRSDKFDNVSIPTYLRFASALGLTPASRHAMEVTGADGDDGNKVAKFRALYGVKGA